MLLSCSSLESLETGVGPSEASATTAHIRHRPRAGSERVRNDFDEAWTVPIVSRFYGRLKWFANRELGCSAQKVSHPGRELLVRGVCVDDRRERRGVT